MPGDTVATVTMSLPPSRSICAFVKNEYIVSMAAKLDASFRNAAKSAGDTGFFVSF